MGIYDRDYMHEPPRRASSGRWLWLLVAVIVAAVLYLRWSRLSPHHSPKRHHTPRTHVRVL